jgi:hypothetical protein
MVGGGGVGFESDVDRLRDDVSVREEGAESGFSEAEDTQHMPKLCFDRRDE